MLKNLYRFSNKFISTSHFSKSSRSCSVFAFGNMQIGTHDGIFHCDEVLACFLLKCLPEYKDAQIIRSRNMEVLKTCDIVIDVGAEFDHQKKRYDHHQREFNETFSTLRPDLGDKYKIKLSSAGLIYTFYGERIIKELTRDSPLSRESLRLIFKKLYEQFIEEIDAIDNGVPMTQEEPKYQIHTDVSSRVKRLNPEWNSSQNVDLNVLFNDAMELVKEEFLFTTNYFVHIWLAARDFVKSSLEERLDVHESGQILFFKDRFPWKEHLFELEEEIGLAGEIKYVLFNDKPGSWRVQAVPVSPGSFMTRKPLHKAWQGVRDEELSRVAGIPGCIFCHSTGFIGGNVSKEGALAMALASLNAVSE